MGLIPQGAYLDSRPFGLPKESREIVFEMPFPPSTNRLHARRGRHVYCTTAYKRWQQEADALRLLHGTWRLGPKIEGPFEVTILLNEKNHGDGDNRIKAVLDYLQSRNIIDDDKHCRRGTWSWVEDMIAPCGAKIRIRTIHK